MSEGGSEQEKAPATDTSGSVAEAIRKQQRIGRQLILVALLLVVTSIRLADVRVPSLILAACAAALGLLILLAASAYRTILEGGGSRGEAGFDARARELRALLSRPMPTVSRVSAALMLAELHWQRGDVDATDDVLSGNLRAKSLTNRGVYGEVFAEAHALRLLAKAARGEASVEGELAALEHAQTSTNLAWARVAATKAIVALRRGDRAIALDALRDIDRLTDSAMPLDRALCRALRALALAGAPVDSYRSPHPSTRGGVVRGWVDRVFPAAADFVDELPVAAEADRRWLSEPTEPKQALPAKRSRAVFLGKVLGGLIGMYSLVATLTVTGDAWYEPWSTIVGFGWIPIAVGIAYIIVQERRARADLARIRAARWQSVLGDESLGADELRELSRSKLPFTSSRALIDLAAREANRGEFAEASALLETGLERLVSLPDEGRNAIQFIEGLVLRAMLLAWQGREAQAESALATELANFPTEPYASSTKYEVRFWTALALARREQALEIAHTCDVHTITSGRTDLARDALLALGDPSAQARVLERIDAWPSMRSFLSTVCPWLLDELRQQSAAQVRVDASPDRLPESKPAESRSAGEGDGDGDRHGRGGSTP